MGRVFGFAVLAAVAALGFAAPARGEVRAGAAAVDASWHVGASAGQYASDGAFGVDPSHGTYDPTVHAYRRAPSYGIQSRLSARAIVVESSGGNRLAIVKNDQYIPQDLLYRRTAQLLEQEGECGITRETLTMVSSHNHSSPFYSSTAWGAWAFQDVFDVRFYEYLARRMYLAVERACDKLVPVRVGASVGSFDKTHRHSFGPQVADDGTPAGYPQSNTDHDVTVIRFDDVSDPARPRPLANLVNFSLHPEFLDGNDLISADYLGPLERMVDRESGALTIYSQGAVGTSEPERSTYHSIHERLEFSHRDYAQAEFGARLMADAVLGVWRDIGAATPADPSRFIPFDEDFPVTIDDRWYPGPFSHPYPGVSNCRTDKGLAGDPQLPVVGLPDCQGVSQGLGSLSDLLGLPAPPTGGMPAIDPGLSTDDFQALGVPVPENYSAPSYTGLQEDIDVHLQAIRLGDILLTACSCEQWFDQSANIETRTDRIVGNEHLGYDWGAECEPAGDGTYAPDGSGTGTWSCPDPRDPAEDLPPVSDRRYTRMRAQVLNPANGWNNAENAASAESEPTDPRQIKGNYTHDDRCGANPLTPGDAPCAPGESSASAALGYGLTVPIGMANDYNGYIATYREYQRGDHYRKALTGWGPHSSDYMASRLVHMGRRLRDPDVATPVDQQQEALLAAKAEADTALNDQRAQALGEVGGAAIAAYRAALPDDGGEAEAVAQPQDVERFGAAFFTWNGGSNFTDNPRVIVEREDSDGASGWQRFADQSGEVQVTLEFPQGADVASYLEADQRWHWTAHFEAFVAAFDLGEEPRATPAGRYRFVVHGMRREGGEAVPYRIASQPFHVRPWSGITVEDSRVADDGTVSFAIGPSSAYTVGGPASEVDVEGSGPVLEARIGPIDYPDSYESPARFIRERRTALRDPAATGDAAELEWFCFKCAFRPWLDAGDASTARVTFVDTRTAAVERVPAASAGDRWQTDRALGPGEVAFVDAGDARDGWANFNGSPGAVLYGPGVPEPPLPKPCEALVEGTPGADALAGTRDSERLTGLGGPDRIRGGAGPDCLFGGPGRDLMAGGKGADFLAGERGADRYAGGPGDDVIVSTRGQADVVRCGAGRDQATVGPVDDVRGCERLRVVR
jgi:hypothetical protein